MDTCSADKKATLALRLSLFGIVSLVLYAIDIRLSPLGWFVSLAGFEYIKAAFVVIGGVLLLQVLVPALTTIAVDVATK